MSAPPKYFKHETLPQAFILREGFHRADWEQVEQWIDANVRPEHMEAAWNEALLVLG